MHKLPSIRSCGPLLALLGATSCVHVSSDPIHIVADINVTVRVERQLDDFFAFEAKYAGPTTTQSAATKPTASL